jgi:ABC-2 type transport system permease protein
MVTALSARGAAGWRQLRLAGRILAMGLQEATAYRAEGAIWFLFDLIPPLVALAIWLAAYRDTTSIGGYDIGAMLAYYVGLIGLRAVLTTHQEHGINYDIKQGKLAGLLVKPLNFWLLCLMTELAWKAWRLALVSPVILVLALTFGGQLAWPGGGALVAVVPALLLAFALCFLLKQCLGYVSFWFIQIDGVLSAYWLTSLIFSGELVPLELLPAAARRVAEALPFAYIYYFPLQVALGRVAGADLWRGLAIQAAWAVAAGLLSVLLWRRGLRHFEGVGL